MIREVSEQYGIDKVYADKAHDNKRSFQLLDGLNIQPAINIRKNASTIKIKTSPLRGWEVFLIKKLGLMDGSSLRIHDEDGLQKLSFRHLKEY